MGFLLGEALEFIVKTYTDSDNQVETVKIHISEYNCLDALCLLVNNERDERSSAEGANQINFRKMKEVQMINI